MTRISPLDALDNGEESDFHDVHHKAPDVQPPAYVWRCVFSKMWCARGLELSSLAGLERFWKTPALTSEPRVWHSAAALLNARRSDLCFLL